MINKNLHKSLASRNVNEILIWSWNNPLHGTYGIDRPVCYHMHIKVMVQVYHMVHMEWICPDVTIQKFTQQLYTRTKW